MNSKRKNLRLSPHLKELLKVEDENLQKLHKIVADALNEEKSLVNILYEENEDSNLTFGEKIADKVATFGGSWTFILSFLSLLGVWTLFNIHFHNKGFDPYPFILLNLVLSCIAALQGPVIMMSQNRKDKKDRKKSEHEYLVNLKAEIQIREINQKFDILMLDQIKVLIEMQKDYSHNFNALRSRLEGYLKNPEKFNKNTNVITK
jgi:uncharacterized membrane protein